MNVVDIVLGVAILVFAINGWRRGFLYGLLALAGFVVGAIVGLWVAPMLVGSWHEGLPKALSALVIVFLFAMAGQVLVGIAGRRLDGVVTWKPAALFNSAAGAVLSVVVVLMVLWFAASLFASGSDSPLARNVRQSEVLGVVDDLMPMDATQVSGELEAMFSNSGFPEVFGGLGPEPVKSVMPPNSAIANRTTVVQSAAQTVKVTGDAPSCNETVTGSGFAFAPNRVMTNAHVVAGVQDPQVSIGGNGKPLDATVVYFDPKVDVAVLAVPDLPVQPLTFASNVERNQNVAVIGYPEEAGLTVSPGRVRDVQLAAGRDIYSTDRVVRQILSMRTQVRPGNSGGPVVNDAGKVVGVVFASSLDSDDTGYAMTADEVSEAVTAGTAAAGEVHTGSCLQ